jgi:hypothetical protein
VKACHKVSNQKKMIHTASPCFQPSLDPQGMASCKLFTAIALLPLLAHGQMVYTDAAFGVKTTGNVTYCQALTCKQDTDPSSCTPMDLQLDIYSPSKNSTADVPPLKPAYILSHGGGNSGGSKEQYCFQGAGMFYAARGFVAFNINYRLKGQNGLIPPNMPGPPSPDVTGAKLVSHIARSNDFFFPHPSKSDSASPHDGPLRFGSDKGTDCITTGAKSATGGLSLSMEKCVDGSPSQQWHLAQFNIRSQHIIHKQSGYCLDIPGAAAAGKAKAGLAIEAVPCTNSTKNTQMWQLGYSGALITENAAMAVALDTSDSSYWEGVEERYSNGSHYVGWKPNWISGYPAVRDLKAAIRFVKANAAKYGVDPNKIVVSGGSAGATNSVAAGATFEGDYGREMNASYDPTLASTNLDQTSTVQVVCCCCRALYFSTFGSRAFIHCRCDVLCSVWWHTGRARARSYCPSSTIHR